MLIKGKKKLSRVEDKLLYNRFVKEASKFILMLVLLLFIFFKYSSFTYGEEYFGETTVIDSLEDFSSIQQKPNGGNAVDVNNNFILRKLYINDRVNNNKLNINVDNGDEVKLNEFYYMKNIESNPFNGNITENELNINNIDVNKLYNINLTAGNKGDIVNNLMHITSGTIGLLNNVIINNSNEGNLINNILNIAGGNLTDDSKNKSNYSDFNHNISIINSTGNISNNVTNITGGNIDRLFRNIEISKNGGNISGNNININMDGGDLKGKLLNLFIYSKNTGDIFNNEINIIKGNFGNSVVNVGLKSTFSHIYNNLINIESGNLSEGIYNIYIYDSKDNKSDIYNNVVNITGGNLEDNIVNVSTYAAAEGISGNIYNNLMKIIGGNLKGKRIVNVNVKAEDNINIHSNSIFIAGDVNIESDIFMARNMEFQYSITTATNSTIFIATDLSHMSNYGKGIYTGSSYNNNSLYFLGDKTTLLDNKIIKDDANVVLSNVDRVPTNTGVSLNKTNIKIGDGINYINNNNILLDGDIILHFSLDSLKSSNNSIGSLVLTSGSIGILDKTSFDGNKKVSIELSSNGTIASLTEGEKYLVFKADSGIDSELLNTYFAVSSNSDIKNFEIIVDRNVNGIYLSYIKNTNDENNNEDGNNNSNLVNYNGLNSLKPFIDSIKNTSNYINQFENKDKYKNDNQSNLLMKLLSALDDVSDGKGSNNVGSLESLLRSWLPDTTGVIYRTSKNNFIHLSNGINDRLIDLKGNNNSYSNDNSNPNKLLGYDNVWTKIYAGEIKQKDNNNLIVNNTNFDSKYFGFIFGGEFINDDKLIFGGALNYNFDKAKTDYKNIYSNSIGLSAYARYNLNLFNSDILFVDGILSYMYSSSKEKTNTDNIDFTSLKLNDVIFKSKFTANQIFTNVGLGLNFKYFEPEVGFNYSFISVDPYEDNYNNSIDRNNYNSLTAFTSLNIKNFADVKLKSITIKPRLFVRYDYDLKKADIKVSGRLNNDISSSKYKINFGEINEKLLQYGINVDIKIINSFKLTIGYEGSRDNDGYINNEVSIMGRVGW